MNLDEKLVYIIIAAVAGAGALLGIIMICFLWYYFSKSKTNDIENPESSKITSGLFLSSQSSSHNSAYSTRSAKYMNVKRGSPGNPANSVESVGIRRINTNPMMESSSLSDSDK